MPILNPVATAPVFLGLTEGASVATRTLLMRRIAQHVLAAAELDADRVLRLEFFGIALPIARVGAGLIVAANAWRLLTATPASADSRAGLAETFTPETARRQAFYPLSFPIICGPGSIAAAINVGVSLSDGRLAISLGRMGGAVPRLVAISLLVNLASRYARQLLKPLGEAGIVIFLRLSAFILLCLGVQIVWDGTYELGVGLLRDALLPTPA